MSAPATRSPGPHTDGATTAPSRADAPIRRGRGDGTTFLTIYAILVFLVPARLVVGPLGGAATPANIFGILGLVWWAWSAVDRHMEGRPPRRPIRQFLVIFVFAILASYISGTLRPISGLEMRSMESGLISLAAWCGVILVASDAIPDIARLTVLLGRLAILGGLEASLGIVQFATGMSFVDQLQIPGLVSNAVAFGVGDRDGFSRPAGTAIHSIEFGVSITALLPICLWVATHPGPAGTFRRWFPVAAIAVAIPLSVSRSAVLGAAVILVTLLPSWSPTMRRWAGVAVVAVIAGIFVLIPGFLGAFGKLFTGISTDPSALSRTDSYSLAFEFISRSPWVGRGFMTFLPEYRILDNQYLGLLIDAGVFGMVALVLLFGVSIVLAFVVRARTMDPDLAAICVAVAAGLGSIALGYAFFDAFAFPMASGVSFLLVGLISAVQRLSSQPSQPRPRRTLEAIRPS
jgi:O-antigen ligase